MSQTIIAGAYSNDNPRDCYIIIAVLPIFAGVKAVWVAQPFVDFVMILIGVIMMVNTLKRIEKVGARQLES